MNRTIEILLKHLKEGKKRTVWFDVDGTLCSTPETQYEKAEPDYNMIALVNMLYDRGCRIYIMTARGAVSGRDCVRLTEDQLEMWGVKYHKLIMGHPRDLYIGDETLRPDEAIEMIE